MMETKKKRSAAPRGVSTQAFVRTRHQNQSELAEDYVELIDDLIENKGEARAVEIAHAMGVSHVTVSKTINRLKEAGLVRSEPYRSVFLTREGRSLARKSRERHRIVLEFLNALGVPPEVAAIDAEGLKHHVSKVTLRIMQDFVEKAR